MTSAWQRRQDLIDIKIKSGNTGGLNTGEGGGAEGYYAPTNISGGSPPSLSSGSVGWGPAKSIKDRLEDMRANTAGKDFTGMGPDGITGPSPINPNTANDASSNPAFRPESIKDDMSEKIPEALVATEAKSGTSASAVGGWAGEALGVGLGVAGAQLGVEAIKYGVQAIQSPQGSINEYLPGTGGGSGHDYAGEASMQAILAAINSTGGIPSRWGG